MNNDRTESNFLNAVRGEHVDCIPVWFMRQAGRYNPRHKELYEKYGVRGITTTPELNARVTCIPVEDLGVDAAVMYADIILPLEDMGIEFHYGAGDKGPVMETEIESLKDIQNLRELNPNRGVPFILDAIQNVQKELPATTPLIGFSGGPFTLACYVLEGHASRTFPKTKRMMYENPQAFNELMKLLSKSIQKYLESQIEAGIDVVQLFDSWMGVLSPESYRKHVQNHTAKIFKNVCKNYPQIPRIHFSTNTGGMIREQFDSGADIKAVDWRISFDQIADLVGTNHVIMGNLDPSMVQNQTENILSYVNEILQAGKNFEGHIFNLGHRIPNGANVSDLKQLVDHVHSF